MSNSFEDDLLADSAPQTTMADVASIQGMVAKALEIQAYIAKAAKLQADASAALGQLLNKDIPDAMASAKTTSVALEDGTTVSVADTISANISADRQEEAFSWLRENGHGDIIKTTLTLVFGRGEETKCSELAKKLVEKHLAPTVKPSVHYQTLNALVRELTAKGHNLPVETLGIWTGRQAKITTPKR